MRISDWSSDVCSSDLQFIYVTRRRARGASLDPDDRRSVDETHLAHIMRAADNPPAIESKPMTAPDAIPHQRSIAIDLFIDGLLTYHNVRSEEHTSELQSLMRISYAVFCLKKKT